MRILLMALMLLALSAWTHGNPNGGGGGGGTGCCLVVNAAGTAVAVNGGDTAVGSK